MALKGIIAAFKKSRSTHDGHNAASSRGTAFLDQKRLLPTAIEKHYIGSMLYAFNFAEEAQRAEGGRPLKVLRRLADDLVSLYLRYLLNLSYLLMRCAGKG